VVDSPYEIVGEAERERGRGVFPEGSKRGDLFWSPPLQGEGLSAVALAKAGQGHCR
jgi:hypothetical protein